MEAEIVDQLDWLNNGAVNWLLGLLSWV